jgi:hypothetical protein
MEIDKKPEKCQPCDPGTASVRFPEKSYSHFLQNKYPEKSEGGKIRKVGGGRSGCPDLTKSGGGREGGVGGVRGG